MKSTTDPDEEKINLIRMIDACYTRFTLKKLPVPGDASCNRYEWLDQHAGFALLAHNAQPDPVFIYANTRALSCFGYDEHEFLSLPSRHGAPPSEHDIRNRLLAEVKNSNHTRGNEGTRVDKSGSLFRIFHYEIWRLEDQEGVLIGQSAIFWPERKR